MITRDLVRICAVGSSSQFSRPMERARAQEWLDRGGGSRGPVKYELRTVPTCECCGEVATHWYDKDNPKHPRCRKHIMRNPCLVEGCGRTFKEEDHRYLGTAQNICGQHWREFVPVGSAQRRIYLRFWRRAKRYGWTDSSIAAFNRYWRALVSHVRAKARGDVDMDEINRIMGW
jgi:hypothetical protein